jgi:RNA polymerase sigma factor (sigma-70 family)
VEWYQPDWLNVMNEPSLTGTVTRWIRDFESGNPAAFQGIFDLYFPRIKRIAANKLRGPGAEIDAEDVAAEVLSKMAENICGGRYQSRLANRHELWLLMLAMMRSLVIDLHRRRLSLKRGAGMVYVASDLQLVNDAGMPFDLVKFVDETSDHEAITMLHDSINYLITQRLQSQRTRDVAKLKLEGYSDEEISRRLGCSEKTVRRKTALIRSLWMKELGIEEEEAGATDDQDSTE